MARDDSIYDLMDTAPPKPAAEAPADAAGSPPPDPATARRVMAAASALVFASSMAIMILELVAARLVAQHLGVSLYTWTSVIGVILAGISLGNYAGGLLADRTSPRQLLPALLVLASICSLGTLWLNQLMDQLARPDFLSWPGWVLVNVAVIFLLPATLLGTIAPVVAKMALDARQRVGATVGGIYAWGAAGSIAGTFLTGFWLIDAFGTRAIVAGVAIFLAIVGLGIALWQRLREAELFAGWLAILAAVLALAFGPWPWAQRWGHFLLWRPDRSHVEYFDESNYFTISVYEDFDLPDTKVLALDNLVHSYVPTDDITDLVYDYETIYAAVTDRVLRQRAWERAAMRHGDGIGTTPSLPPIRAFFIGGGGYVFPRYLEEVYPTTRIDVAEIDPAVEVAAREALGLPPPGRTRIRTWAMDARRFVDARVGAGHDVRYDFVYGDAFNDLSVPWHLTTREFNERLRRLMAPDGVYMINVIDIFREGRGRFLGSYVRTALRTFPCLYVFSSDADGPGERRDTFVVVGARRPLDLHDLGERPADVEFEGRLFAWSESGRHGGDMETVLERGAGLLLTDDHAPVENLLAPLFDER